ncbi:MAG: hypothetical protein AAF493_13145 [Pseudomonadota bacterium]
MKTEIGAAAMVAMLLVAGQTVASECPPLPGGMRCAAEQGDPRAMYVVGREAYDEARKTGDFTEAHMWATKAKKANFLAGKMLFKMVHLQVGEGNHNNVVEGHRWLSTAIKGGAEYLVPWRQRLEAKMTDAQIAEAHSE